jgi:hypothetical protein
LPRDETTDNVQMHPAAVVLMLALTRGERLAEVVSSSDRVSWVLPKVKLDHARATGIVVDEDTVTVANIAASVTGVQHGLASLDSHATVTTLDVPRRIRMTREADDDDIVDGRNSPHRSGQSPEAAATADLPVAAVHVGSTWTTREAVLTTLGSGVLVIVHTVTADDGDRVNVLIHGTGAIVGIEYDLPRLLPGTMLIDGTAVFDRTAGTFVRESYTLHNALLKPDGAEHIGFDEHEKISITTSVER